MYHIKKINKKLAIVLSITLSVLLAACTSTKESGRSGPLVIQDQGSFAVGRIVITNPGTFDPIKHGAFNPTG